MSGPEKDLLGANDVERPSKTARAMFEAKLRRVNAMSPRDRMKLALQLGRQLRALGTAPKR